MTIMAGSEGLKCSELLFMVKNEACPQDWK